MKMQSLTALESRDYMVTAVYDEHLPECITFRIQTALGRDETPGNLHEKSFDSQYLE